MPTDDRTASITDTNMVWSDNTDDLGSSGSDNIDTTAFSRSNLIPGTHINSKQWETAKVIAQNQLRDLNIFLREGASWIANLNPKTWGLQTVSPFLAYIVVLQQRAVWC
jgi:hypothetical protein